MQISMYINSQGGVVTSGLAIYDTMQVCQTLVGEICYVIALQDLVLRSFLKPEKMLIDLR